MFISHALEYGHCLIVLGAGQGAAHFYYSLGHCLIVLGAGQGAAHYYYSLFPFHNITFKHTRIVQHVSDLVPQILKGQFKRGSRDYVLN
jgi:hypothetical protein